MAEDVTTIDDELIFVRQPAGAEDLMFGFGSVSQVREGDNVTVNLINAGIIPYDATRTIGDVLAELLAAQATT